MALFCDHMPASTKQPKHLAVTLKFRSMKIWKVPTLYRQIRTYRFQKFWIQTFLFLTKPFSLLDYRKDYVKEFSGLASNLGLDNFSSIFKLNAFLSLLIFATFCGHHLIRVIKTKIIFFWCFLRLYFWFYFCLDLKLANLVSLLSVKIAHFLSFLYFVYLHPFYFSTYYNRKARLHILALKKLKHFAIKVRSKPTGLRSSWEKSWKHRKRKKVCNLNLNWK